MLSELVKRHSKLFFKDKGMFFTSLITPAILLILYSTFLARIYRDSYRAAVPEGFILEDRILNGLVGGQLVASLLAVSCVTVTFCVNLVMIQDRSNGAIKDLTMAPVKSTTLALSYYVSTLISTLFINFITLGISLIYLRATGWYMSSGTILMATLGIFLTCMFATALSSIICYPLKSQGAASAVGSIVSSAYGFICGAYMPISNFGAGLQRVLSFLPGTYCTSYLKNAFTKGAFNAMADAGVPQEMVYGVKKSIDCEPDFLGHTVTEAEMILIMVLSIAVLLSVYIAINVAAKKKKTRPAV